MQNTPAETPEDRLVRLFGSTSDLAAIAFEDARVETLETLQPIIETLAVRVGMLNVLRGPGDTEDMAARLAGLVEGRLADILNTVPKGNA